MEASFYIIANRIADFFLGCLLQTWGHLVTQLGKGWGLLLIMFPGGDSVFVFHILIKRLIESSFWFSTEKNETVWAKKGGTHTPLLGFATFYCLDKVMQPLWFQVHKEATIPFAFQ